MTIEVERAPRTSASGKLARRPSAANAAGDVAAAEGGGSWTAVLECRAVDVNRDSVEVCVVIQFLREVICDAEDAFDGSA
jgi:hypothetical protein